jgi:multidrug efflux pump
MWYQVRKNIGDMRHTLPQGVLGPFFNDDSATPSASSTASPPTASASARTARLRGGRALAPAAGARRLEDRDPGRAGRAIFIEFSTERLAGLRLNLRRAGGRAAGAEPGAPGRRDADRAGTPVFLRVSGAFETEADIEAVNFVIGDRIFRLGDIARCAAASPTRRSRCSASTASRRSAWRSRCATGDILALGENVAAEMARSAPTCRSASSPSLVADQAVTVDEAINDFMTSLWQAIVIILVCSFVSLGVRPGAVVALAIPLTLAIVFPVMMSLASTCSASRSAR